MALVVTYDPVLSRMRLVATGLGALATYAFVWRTTNGFASSTVVRGGSFRPVAGGSMTLDDYEFEPGVPVTYRVTSYHGANIQDASFDATITQDLDDVWLKVPALPFLNRQVVTSAAIEVTRRSRGAAYDVVGRTYPVAVADIRSGKQFDLQVRTQTPAEYRDVDLLLASGEVLFLHVPTSNTRVPTGYYVAGDVKAEPTGRVGAVNEWVFTLPLTEVAAPNEHVVGSTYTWSSTLFEYANWTAELAGNATWAALLERVGDPGEVIVP